MERWRQYSCLLLRSIFGIIAFAFCLHAHEIGTTHVNAFFFSSGNYDISITTDAAALVEKLTSVAGETFPADLSVIDLQQRLRGFDEIFRKRLSITFDGIPNRPIIDYSVSRDPTDSAAVASIKMTGASPKGSNSFTWNYSWTFATYALTVRSEHSPATTMWLDGGRQSSPISLNDSRPPSTRFKTAVCYLALGFTHIVPEGFDHVLFVLGIFLLTRRVRHVLTQVSAFTLAHSITLALSMYGVVAVSPRVVEPLIAFSIAYVAIENLFMSELRSWRVVLVFAFGLLHGMGFAGALKDLGLPRSEFVTALVTFNLGVEAGQLTVIAAAFLLVGWYCGKQSWYRRRVVLPASALIAATAVYWTIQRLAL